MVATPPDAASGGPEGERVFSPLGGRGPGYGTAVGGVRLNPELLVFLVVWAVVAVCWIVSDDLRVNEFLRYTVVLTFGYLVSRGIAKATRVHE